MARPAEATRGPSRSCRVRAAPPRPPRGRGQPPTTAAALVSTTIYFPVNYRTMHPPPPFPSANRGGACRSFAVSFCRFLSVRNRFDSGVEINRGCCNGNGDAVGEISGLLHWRLAVASELSHGSLWWHQYISQTIALPYWLACSRQPCSLVSNLRTDGCGCTIALA